MTALHFKDTICLEMLKKCKPKVRRRQANSFRVAGRCSSTAYKNRLASMNVDLRRGTSEGYARCRERWMERLLCIKKLFSERKGILLRGILHDIHSLCIVFKSYLSCFRLGS